MAGVVSGFVSDVAWLMKNAALRKDVPTFSWATVATGSPLTVMLDGTTVSRRVSANAAGHCMPGDRVRVEVQGTRVTVLANPMRSGGVRIWGGTVDVVLSNQSVNQTTFTLPDGMFTDANRMFITGNATNYQTRYIVRTLINSTSQATVGVSHAAATALTTTVPVQYIIIQNP